MCCDVTCNEGYQYKGGGGKGLDRTIRRVPVDGGRKDKCARWVQIGGYPGERAGQRSVSVAKEANTFNHSG